MPNTIVTAKTEADLKAIYDGPFTEAGYAKDYPAEKPEEWMKTLGFDNEAKVKQIIIASRNEQGVVQAAVMAQVYPDGNVLVGFTPMTNELRSNPELVKQAVPDMLKRLREDLEQSGQKIGGIFMERPRPDDKDGTLKREISEQAGFSWLKTRDGKEYAHYEPVWDKKEADEIAKKVTRL